MTATDQLRDALRTLEAKARELELDKKLEKFADSADHLLREAAVKAGDYAHDNRGKVEGALDRAGATVDEKTDGKYHRTVEKVKTGVLLGVDWVAEQRESTATPAWATGSRWGAAPDAAGADAASAGAAGAGAPSPDADASAPAPATPAPGADAPAGSADSDAWVDVTDAPPTRPGSTDPS